MKKFIVLGLILLLAVSVFVTSNIMVPEKTEALPAWWWMQAACCWHYAVECPPDVVNLCFSDCMELSDCYNGY